MIACSARGQQQTQISGISVDVNGVLEFRQPDARAELDRIRGRGRAGSGEKSNLRYVSLPKTFADARAALEAGRALPPGVRYLGGLTRIDYILVYPEEHDLMIAGPAEEVDEANPLEPRGKLTGRPIVQFEDLVTALRMTSAERRPRPFGCSIDMPPDAFAKSAEIKRTYLNGPRAEYVRALAEAIGPQPIRLFGTPPDSRTAFVCVAADYQLKRYALNLDVVPVPGVGNPIDNTRQAGSAFWFETMYEPLLESPDGNAFQIRGQRLQLKCGQLVFDTRDATPTAKAFTKRFTDKIPQLAQAAPIYADLQNLADLSLLGALMRQENLAAQAGWDFAWAMDETKCPVRKIPVAKETATLANFSSGSVVAGGVSLGFSTVVAKDQRQADGSGALARVRTQGAAQRERMTPQSCRRYHFRFDIGFFSHFNELAVGYAQHVFGSRLEVQSLARIRWTRRTLPSWTSIRRPGVFF
jgi:hypothetical protein